MKKIAALILLVICLSSCIPEGRQIETEDGAKMLVREFSYGGHDYIEFTRHYEVYDNCTGFVHSPECRNPKCNKHESDQDNQGR